jgi:hypothetical protein
MLKVVIKMYKRRKRMDCFHALFEGIEQRIVKDKMGDLSGERA